MKARVTYPLGAGVAPLVKTFRNMTHAATLSVIFPTTSITRLPAVFELIPFHFLSRRVFISLVNPFVG